MAPDWKPAPRIVDRDATKRKLLLDRRCRACGLPATNCHHLIGKGQQGDDVEDNLVPLCGSGAHGCHGALHGNPYVAPGGRRWEAQDVRLAIGLSLTPSEYTYVVTKLALPSADPLAAADWKGAPGREFLREHYHVEAFSIASFRMVEWAPF